MSSADFADGAVTTAKLVDDSVTTAKLADGGVGTDDFAADAVTSVQIADRSITGLDIARGQTITSDHIVDGTVVGDTILDASVGEVDLDIKLISDFDVIARTGQQADGESVAIARAFGNAGTLTSATGTTLADVSIGDKVRIYELIDSFTTSGLVATGQQVFQGLSSDIRLQIGALLGGAALAQQEIGNRTASLGDEWASSSLRGQTNWLNARTTELGERVDFTHASISSLDGRIEAVDRGIAMAGAVGGTYVEHGRHASFDLAVTDFGDKQGMSVGMGFRVTGFTQINFAAASTHDFDETLLRFGALLQY